MFFHLIVLKNIISKEMQYNAEKFIAFGCLMKLQGQISNKENNEKFKNSIL